MSHVEITALYRKYVAMLRSSAMRILRDKQRAEDVVQETFAQFLRCSARGDTIQYPGAYLYRIAMRLSIKALRHDYTYIEMKFDHGSAVGGHTEAQIDINKVLSLADEEEACIALMHYVEGMKQEEISRVLNMAPRTVSYRIQCFCERAAKIFSGPGTGKGTVYQVHFNAAENQIAGESV